MCFEHVLQVGLGPDRPGRTPENFEAAHCGGGIYRTYDKHMTIVHRRPSPQPLPPDRAARWFCFTELSITGKEAGEAKPLDSATIISSRITLLH